MKLKSRLVAGSGLVLSAVLAMTAVVGFDRATAREPEADAPSNVRRLTETQYRSTIADVFGPDIKVVGRFEPDLRVEGLLAVGTTAVSITPAGLEHYDAIAQGIAAQVTDANHREKLVGCAPNAQDVDGAQCAKSFFARVGPRLYRRALAPAEIRALASAAVSSAKLVGTFDGGLSTVLAGMMTSPEFLFRIDAPGKGGAQVDGYSKASRLSYFLWNTAPDEALLKAAANGALDTPEGLAKEVDRMMASARMTDGVRAFFADFLRLDDMATLTKDTLLYPAFSPAVAEAAREQTLRTIVDHVVTRDADYRDLFTSRRFAMTKALGPIYDIPVSKSGWYIHEFPENDPRSGLLTQASLLALHSHPGRTSPTLRGVGTLEILLCQKTPPPPPDVNFSVVQDVNNPTLKTTRERLQAHLTNEQCATCHRATDPIGLALEQFDGAGTFRTTERGDRIDVSGKFERQDFNGAAELGKILRQSPRVSSCLVSSVWRYANGRDPGPADAADVEAMKRRFTDDGYRVTALMRTIALDPEFYAYSRPQPSPEPKRQASQDKKGRNS